MKQATWETVKEWGELFGAVVVFLSVIAAMVLVLYLMFTTPAPLHRVTCENGAEYVGRLTYTNAGIAIKAGNTEYRIQGVTCEVTDITPSRWDQ